MTTHQAQVLFLCVCSVLSSSRSGYAKEKLTFTPKKAGQYQARPESCEIQVFQDSKPDQAYDDLGIINYHDERHQMNAGSLKLEVVMPKIKASACKAGADALIDIRVTEVKRLEFVMFNVRATAVRFAPK
jgi:hypothetical protein